MQEHPPDRAVLPAWAWDQATEESSDEADPAEIEEHAWAIVRAVREVENERHDEYDDPDQGGEG